MRAECDLAQRIKEGESAAACFSAKKGRAPVSWEEVAADPDCGIFGVPRDFQGRPLAIKTIQGSVVVTDVDGNRGGNWLRCGPGLVGMLVLLLLLIGATLTVSGVVKKARAAVLIGIALLGGALILNRFWPIE